MSRNADDVRRTAVYGVNAVARGLLPLGLIAVAAGLVLLWTGNRRDMILAAAAAAIGAVILAYAAIRALAPSKPLVELSPGGLLMRIPGAVTFTIPWHAVRDIGIVDVTVTGIPSRYGSRTAMFENVTAVSVTRDFYERNIHVDSFIRRGPGWDATFIPQGELVQVALHHELMKVPAQELREAVELRWRAFGGEAARAGSVAASATAPEDKPRTYRVRSVIVRHGAAPVALAISIILIGLGILAYAGLWPFQARGVRDRQDWAEYEREWAERERRTAEIEAAAERQFRAMAEEARKRQAQEEEERRQRALIAEEYDRRRRAELAAGGPLPPPSPTPVSGHRGPVLTLAVAPNERSFVSGGRDGALKLWDTRAATALRDLAADRGGVRAAVVLSDGRSVLAADGDHDIVWRSLPDGEVRHAFHAPDQGAAVALAAMAGGGRLVSLHQSGALIVWDLAGQARLADLNTGGARQTALATSGSGAYAVSGDADGAVRVWDGATATPVRTLVGHGGAIRSVALTPDGGRAVTAGEDGTMRLWDLGTGAEIGRFAGHSGAVVAVAIDAAGERIVSASVDGTARLWDLARGRELCRVTSLKGPFHAAAFVANGHFVVGGEDGAIRLFDPEGRERMRYFPAVQKP